MQKTNIPTRFMSIPLQAGAKRVAYSSPAQFQPEVRSLTRLAMM
jgi:hypothetical protein